MLGKLTCREGRMLCVTLENRLTSNHSERLKVIGKVGVRAPHSLILRQDNILWFSAYHILDFKQAGKLDQKV